MNGRTEALTQVSDVFIALLGSVAILATVGLGIAVLRIVLTPTEEGRARGGSQVAHILGVVAGIGAIGSIAMWIMATIGTVGQYTWKLPFY